MGPSFRALNLDSSSTDLPVCRNDIYGFKQSPGLNLLAEGQGFEPWIPCGKPPFQGGAIDQLGDPSSPVYFNKNHP